MSLKFYKATNTIHTLSRA